MQIYGKKSGRTLNINSIMFNNNQNYQGPDSLILKKKLFLWHNFDKIKKWQLKKAQSTIICGKLKVH